MDMHNHPQPAGRLGDGPDALRAALAGLAGGIDTHFVGAGTALSQTYAVVEQMIAALEQVTGAIDREGALTAIADMQATADRLTNLPALQGARAAALRDVQAVSVELSDQIDQVHRTLSFLRICGMNIKVASAGMEGFGNFADGMFAKLEVAEAEMAQIAREVETLAKAVPEVFAVEKRLAEECAAVVPHVPTSLTGDAAALQQHQASLAERAERIASVAHGVRSQVATALGALQVGDITRQRVEHIVHGMDLLDQILEAHEEAGIDNAAIVRSHAMAMLAAQAADAAAEFEREVSLLMESLRGLAPRAAALLEFRPATETDGTDPEAASLSELGRSVAEAESVTGRLREADTQAQALGAAISRTAERLGERLRNVARVKGDVQHMAWNTDLRCYRMGNEGRGLAVVASEIRGFATTLESNAERIGLLFRRLAAAAGAIRGQQGEGVTRSLADSLRCICDAGNRMRDGLSGLGDDASAVTDMLRDAVDTVNCAELASALAGHAERLAQFGAVQEVFPEPAEALLREHFEAMMRSYTMAREREVHRLYSSTLGAESDSVAPPAAEDDDDGLF